MTVTGPDWPTTRSLRAALAGVDSPRILHWGQSPCDKLTALQRFAEAGLPVPAVVTTLADAKVLAARGEQMWGRNTHHSHGTDIARRVGKRWRSKDFWVQYLPSEADFRVHVWGGKCFRMGIKTHPEEQNASPIRSAKNGWTLNYSGEVVSSLTTPDLRGTLRDTARAGCTALRVTGGAVDLLLGRDGRVYLLEVNTAPALGDHTLEAYVAQITKWALRKEALVATP